MRLLLIHSCPLDRLGGAELSLRDHVAAAPPGVTVDVALPDAPVDLKKYDTVVLSNLRPFGGLGEAAEYLWAQQWIDRLRGYRGYVIKLEHDVHPCTYRDARCINFDNIGQRACDCTSPIRRTFEELYNLCDAIIFLSPLHRRVINRIIHIKTRRQYDIATPVDFNRFRSIIPFNERKHAALITGDALRVAPEAVALAEAQGYPVERVEYLSVPYEEMPELLNRYQAVVVAPVMLHAFGRLVAEAMACGCQVITNNRVGAMSYLDPIAASRNSNADFWRVVARRPLWPNPRRVRRQREKTK
jgi:glycosyltransferase involved in cell wall biosynthesis